MEWSRRHLGWPVACVALAAVVTLFQPDCHADTSPPGAKIGAVSQQAYAGAVAQADGGLQRPIKFGNPVYVLETVRTGPDGSTELQFLDEARLQIGANASVKLDQYSYDPAGGNGGGLIDMFVGAYDFASGRMNSDDKVKLVTPTVTIGLRGTALSVYIAGDGRTDVTVKSGLVSLAPCRGGAIVAVGAGQRASVSNDCVVTNPDADPSVQPQPFRRQDFIIHKPPRQSPPRQPKTRGSTG
ncbi:MAG TPA: FecR family protein [Dongiaceae bacterium]|nr:FecR family protein [Dongiaceae bacterium]